MIGKAVLIILALQMREKPREVKLLDQEDYYL